MYRKVLNWKKKSQVALVVILIQQYTSWISSQKWILEKNTTSPCCFTSPLNHCLSVLTLPNIPLDSLQYNSLLTVVDVFSSPLNSITWNIGSLSSWIPIIAGMFLCLRVCMICASFTISLVLCIRQPQERLILWKILKCTGHMNPVLVLIPFHWLVEAQMDQLN